MSDIVERLVDLHKQATEERSHFYTGKCIRDAIAEITRLREALAIAQKHTAKDVLLYLYSDCAEWDEDVDGDCHDDGTPYAIINHRVRITDEHLSELLDMADIPPAGMMETTLERLKRANDEDLAAIRARTTIE